MSRGHLAVGVGLGAWAALLSSCASLCLASPPPASFFGVVPQGPLAAGDFARMQGTIGTLRYPFEWRQVEPAPGKWDFSALDAEVGAAARRGIRVMPVLYGVPAWVHPDPARPPAGAGQRAGWAAFVRQVVRRYGPGGDFWQGARRPLPIRRWQVWNEPNFQLFWRPRPEPTRYVRLLRDSGRVIRSVDPGAIVVAAGIAPVQGGMRPAEFLREMYAVPGARRTFDVAASHPYSAGIGQLVFQLRQIRTVMEAAGDGAKPLHVSEIGVASSARVRTPFDRGLRGQARFLRRALGLLLRERRPWRIAGVAWFSWKDGRHDPHCPFCQHAGLLKRNGAAKPAWRAYRKLVVRARLPRL
jgi:hypothetical protein